MQRSLGSCLLCTLVVVLAGCGAGGGFWGANGDDGINESAVCVTEGKGDPLVEKCLIAERPADLRVENMDSEDHNVTVRVVRNRSTVVLLEMESFRMGLSPRETYEDVFDRPGTYTITATVDDRTTESVTWNASRRYSGDGDVKWEILVHSVEEIEVRKPPSM